MTRCRAEVGGSLEAIECGTTVQEGRRYAVFAQKELVEGLGKVRSLIYYCLPEGVSATLRRLDL